MTTRRQFLYGAAAMAAATGIPLQAIKAQESNNRKFIFVFNPGGWDPTRVLATPFGNPNVAMEADSELSTIAGLPFVDHPLRPSVRSFFELNADRSVIFNGMMVRSIAHDICTMIALTGTSDGTSPDWPAVMAARQRESFTLPHLVIDGPSFPGDLGVAVARTGTAGQLDLLTSGDALEWTDTPIRRLKHPSESLIDRYLQRRSRARADSARGSLDQSLSRDVQLSLEKAQSLKDLRYSMNFNVGGELSDQIDLAVAALAGGVSRCVSIAHTGGVGWDTHANNDATQTVLWESLFQGLALLMQQLDSTPGTSSPTLAEETTVVVISEMGRTPMLNGTIGKDHWPYTSALLIGAGLQGGRAIGGFDSSFYGDPVDPASGESSASGQVLSAESLGATLLTMADIDPDEYIAGVAPITGILT